MRKTLTKKTIYKQIMTNIKNIKMIKDYKCIKQIHMKNKVDYKKWHGLDNSFKQEKCLMKSFQGSTLSNPFWNSVKAFIGNKGTSSNDNIIIKAKNDNTINVKGNKLVPLNTGDKICDENLLVEMFNNHYI